MHHVIGVSKIKGKSGSEGKLWVGKAACEIFLHHLCQLSYAYLRTSKNMTTLSDSGFRGNLPAPCRRVMRTTRPPSALHVSGVLILSLRLMNLWISPVNFYPHLQARHEDYQAFFSTEVGAQEAQARAEATFKVGGEERKKGHEVGGGQHS